MPIISFATISGSGEQLGQAGVPIAPGVVTYTVDDGISVWRGNVVDDSGAYWVVEQEDGWSDSPDVRLATPVRPNWDGAFNRQHYYSPRLVTLKGRALYPSLSAYRSGQRAFASLLGSRLATLTVEDGLGPLSAEVRLAGPVRSRMRSPLLMEWQIDLLAPDPRKYGPEQVVSTGLALETGGLEFPLFTDGSVDVGFLDFGDSTSTGRVTLSNPGTAQARPVFTVTGDLADGFELVETYTGSRLRYEGPVTSQGDAVTLDSATGRVRLGTADRGGMLTRNDWFGLPANGAREVLFLSNGAYSPTAQLTVSVRPTYW